MCVARTAKEGWGTHTRTHTHPPTGDDLATLITNQVHKALTGAKVAIFVIDGREGMLPNTPTVTSPRPAGSKTTMSARMSKS